MVICGGVGEEVLFRHGPARSPRKQTQNPMTHAYNNRILDLYYLYRSCMVPIVHNNNCSSGEEKGDLETKSSSP